MQGIRMRLVCRRPGQRPKTLENARYSHALGLPQARSEAQNLGKCKVFACAWSAAGPVRGPKPWKMQGIRMRLVCRRPGQGPKTLENARYSHALGLPQARSGAQNLGKCKVFACAWSAAGPARGPEPWK